MDRINQAGELDYIYKANEMLVNTDPCFSLEYAKLYEEKENGQAEKFVFESDKGRIEHVFIKRKISITLEGIQYYDITTPYGYGGPVIVNGEHRRGLLADYFEAFHDYCLKENIVSEFIRFHLIENTVVRECFYGDTAVIGPHVVKDLQEPLKTNMARDVQQGLNRAKRLGLTIHFDTTGDRVDDFIKVYEDTMKRNHASDYYHFEPSFFDELHTNLKNKYVYVSAELNGETVSSRLAIHGGNHGFGFLGGTLKEYFHTQATTAVDYYLLDYLKEIGCRYFSFGGGYKSNDGIYKYKKKFSKQNDIPFYIGKKVHLHYVYDQLVDQHRLTKHFDSDASFFPLYRI